MTTTGQFTRILFLVGRFIAGGMYLSAGIQNLIQLDAKAGYTASKGVSNATFWVTVASILLIVGGISIVAGIRPNFGVAALVLFLVPVTLIMHNFWTMTGLQAELEMHSFMGNAGLIGSALLFLAIPQPWVVSVDQWVASRVSKSPALKGMVTGRQNTIADVPRS